MKVWCYREMCYLMRIVLLSMGCPFEGLRLPHSKQPSSLAAAFSVTVSANCFGSCHKRTRKTIEQRETSCRCVMKPTFLLSLQGSAVWERWVRNKRKVWGLQMPDGPRALHKMLNSVSGSKVQHQICTSHNNCCVFPQMRWRQQRVKGGYVQITYCKRE